MTEVDGETIDSARETKIDGEHENKKTNKLDSLPKESLINLLKKQVTITKQLKQQVADTKKELDDLRTQVKNTENRDNTVIQLELSDYKKSLEQIKKKLEVSETSLAKKDGLLNEVVEKMKTLTEQNMALEDEKQNLEKEIGRLTAESKEKDLKLEEIDRNAGDLKKMSDEKEKKIVNQLSEFKDTIERQGKVLEETRTVLQHTKEENVNLVRINQRIEDSLESVRNEFKKYKDRAEFLLSSQSDNAKSKVNDGFELEEMSRQLAQRNSELAELNDKIIHIQHELNSQKERNAALKSELEDSRMSVTLIQKDFNEQRKRIVNEYDERIKSLTSDNDKLRLESIDWRERALKSQAQTPVASNIEEIKELNKQVSLLKDEILTYKQREMSNVVETPRMMNYECHHKKSVPNPINFNIESYYHGNPQDGFTEPVHRPEGDLVKSLKNVLEARNDDETASTLNFETYSLSDSFMLEPEIAAQQLEHMKELLQDTEETNAKLEDQVRVLKEEIRRSEREKEREKHLAKNTEYLKNVVIKFLAPEKVNDGRTQLLPVLCTLLSLTPQEKDKIQEYLKSQGVQESTHPPSEWSGYFGPLSGIF
ncbi:unnamed protein product [Bursaphelenchus xylophilus]|uniref:(pine wood nematode) hypothetical protein n=1 Tax=Bursaphelenchus xylophilus TaxID=6326 RepID=A0A1I7SMT8_BURXY|nr:unnamed protein product [Bursaphelenchus xylophilus]CAG9130373.1 unnamed protein product [Bursaphelenchus xylophilus]